MPNTEKASALSNNSAQSLPSQTLQLENAYIESSYLCPRHFVEKKQKLQMQVILCAKSTNAAPMKLTGAQCAPLLSSNCAVGWPSAAHSSAVGNSLNPRSSTAQRHWSGLCEKHASKPTCWHRSGILSSAPDSSVSSNSSTP